jgi:hypothetical protein
VKEGKSAAGSDKIDKIRWDANDKNGPPYQCRDLVPDNLEMHCGKRNSHVQFSGRLSNYFAEHARCADP